MELCSVLKAQQEGASGTTKKALAETAMEARTEDEDEEEEVEDKGTKTQDSNQDMAAKDPRTSSEGGEEKAET